MKTTKIQFENHLIEVGDLRVSSFSKLLRESYSNSKKVILCDEHTKECCLEFLLTEFEELKSAEIIEIPSGEENKTMDICHQVWETLSEFHFSRKDLLINLGGGMVSDLGGFVASIYKRGIDFINIPTSLLAMVDASIGGKTGVDLGKYKNQLGVFSNPKAVYIDTGFLSTLPQNEKKNGFAEMLKHGLIKSKKHWDDLVQVSSLDKISVELICDSIEIKKTVVQNDPFEKNERKILNFGHTFGHAVEGFYLGTADEISHGHAVAIGIICESYLSLKKGFLSQENFEIIQTIIDANYKKISLNSDDFIRIYKLMLQDKKNNQDKINCVLLQNIGEALIDVEIKKEEVVEVLDYLFD